MKNLLAQSTLFQKLAQNNWQEVEEEAFQKFRQQKASLKDLARQAMENDDALQVLTDTLIEDGRIRTDQVIANDRMNYKWLFDDVMNVVIGMFYGSKRGKLVSEVEPGDCYIARGGSLVDWVVSSKELEEDEFSSTRMRIRTVGNNWLVKTFADRIVVREPPPDWNRQAIISRFKRGWPK